MVLGLSKKGFTLIELVIVLAVIVILAAIAIPILSGLVDRAEESADNAELTILNRATAVYAAQMGPAGDIFAGFSTDADRIQALVDARILSSFSAPRQEGYAFSWDLDGQIWVLSPG